ncbi:helix-turn-helix domain-containing protein [Clostridium sp. HV4-5-A1G]|uniref:helix-turn-helix domain-containing protein n=1 Tax=Clostridium sp. HV4-5-A1G TaxID=2004595 RepID=UPI0012394206|nr:helix-turn-helix transcriptional regulator [Clostridium sp. HV4-5-A1G]KAA8669682.1 helix-turn-helix transcriptional regulator [Clostridium sp. HV4-5-A1G]
MKNTIDNKAIGERIRIEREKLNLTREEFSELISISSVFLSQIERGERQMSMNTLIKVSTELDVSIDYIIWGEDSIEVNKAAIIERINTASKRELKVIDEVLKAILPNLKK